MEVTVTVTNRAGIHTRPAATIVKLASQYKSSIYLSKDGFEINAKSIIGVMCLTAEQGSQLVLRVEGEDETEAAEAMKQLFADGFNE